MKSLIYLAYIAGVITIAMQCIGCTGMEVGGKLWVTRVDEKQESQRTTNLPLKCYLWSDCSQQSTAQGS